MTTGGRPSRRALLQGGAAGLALTAAAVAVTTDRRGLADMAARLDDSTARASIGPVWPDHRLGMANVVWRVPTDRKVVALTFDDGPMPEYTPAVLSALAKLDVRATFFLVGAHVERHPDLVRGELAGRHELGSHTMHHTDLGTAVLDTARSELRDAHDVIRRVAGKAPTVMRPPYGHIRGEALVAAAELGYAVVAWTVKFHEDLYDAAGNADYIVDNLVPGAIVLAHDTGNRSRLKDVQALPRLVTKARAAGYEFVTVSELLAVAAPA